MDGTTRACEDSETRGGGRASEAAAAVGAGGRDGGASEARTAAKADGRDLSLIHISEPTRPY